MGMTTNKMLYIVSTNNMLLVVMNKYGMLVWEIIISLYNIKIIVIDVHKMQYLSFISSYLLKTLIREHE